MKQHVVMISSKGKDTFTVEQRACMEALADVTYYEALNPLLYHPQRKAWIWFLAGILLSAIAVGMGFSRYQANDDKPGTLLANW